MLEKTRGIVLHTIPYKDNYSIVHIYTEHFGRVSYMVSGGSRKRRGVSRSLFLPLSVLDMDVEHGNRRDIQRIKEAHLCFPFIEIACNPIKNMLALFLSEVLFRVVKDTEADSRLFRFLYDSVLALENLESGIANFHLAFLLHLLYYIGIYPNVESRSDDSYFDMLNSIFVSQRPNHVHYLDKQESIVMVRLLKITYENMSLYSFSRQDRVRIIERLLEYYRLHLPEFPEIRSLAVMQTMFD